MRPLPRILLMLLLIGLSYSGASALETLPIRDTCNRVENPLASGWLGTFDPDFTQVWLANGTTCTTAGGGQAVTYWPAAFAGNHGIAIDATDATTTSTNGISLWVGIQQPSASAQTVDAYRCNWAPAAVTVGILRTTNGSGGTQLGGGPISHATADGDQLACQKIGNTISAWQNTGSGWQLVMSVVDATFPCTAPNPCDVGIGLSTNNMAIDNIRFGPVTSERLGLHVTTDELAVWQQRAVSGPYKTAGDVSTNSPGDWTTIASEAAAFKASPTTDQWTGQTAATCMAPGDTPLPRSNPDLGEPIMFAGFYAMVTGDATYRAPVLAELLYHAAQPGLNFADTSRWCVSVANTDNPFFDVAIWLTRLLHAYDWIRPAVGPTDQAILDQWFLAAGVFFEAVTSRTREGWFVDPNHDNYTLTSQGTTDCGTSGERLTHFGGFAAKNFHKHYNNRASEVVYFYTAVGAMLDDTLLKSRGARWVEEWIKYSIFADGTPSEFERWMTTIPTQGWRYHSAALANALMIADMLCRAGDCALYNYSTSEGVCTPGTAGGPKTLLSILAHAYSYVVPATTRYGTDQSGNNGVAAYRIDTEDGIDGQGSVRDVYSAGANVFYQDSALGAIYRRTAGGAPAYPAAQEGCGGCYKWGGVSGKWPGALFMFGQMEGLVWPYSPVSTITPTPQLPTILLLAPPTQVGSNQQGGTIQGGTRQ